MGNEKEEAEEEAASLDGGAGEWQETKRHNIFSGFPSDIDHEAKWWDFSAASGQGHRDESKGTYAKVYPADTPVAPLPIARSPVSVAPSSKDASKDLDSSSPLPEGINASKCKTTKFMALSTLQDPDVYDPSRIAHFTEGPLASAFSSSNDASTDVLESDSSQLVGINSECKTTKLISKGSLASDSSSSEDASTNKDMLYLAGFLTEECHAKYKRIICEDFDVSFQNFPYDLSESTKSRLLASLSTSRVLLSGPKGSEIYQEKYQITLIEALANYIGSKLLIVDYKVLHGARTINFVNQVSTGCKLLVVDPNYLNGKFHVVDEETYVYREGDKVRYVGPSRADCPAFGSRGQVLFTYRKESGHLYSTVVGVRFNQPFLSGSSLDGICEDKHGLCCDAEYLVEEFSDVNCIDELFEVISSEIKKQAGVILFIKDIVESVIKKNDTYEALMEKLDSLPPNVIVFASDVKIDKYVGCSTMKKVNTLFPSKFLITEGNCQSAKGNWSDW